ncbi:enoyl-CoA hydratase [Sinorhizobium meliloti]|uniref:enoyl-CoA hydratase n=1 Tax=Rhizobium meliloti TaxID=382 RepID=UPI003D6534C7
MEERSQDVIRYRKNNVEWFLFNRPHVRNAETEWMDEELVRTCEDVNKDPTVKALVFAGAASQPPCFTSGADFSRLGAIGSYDDIQKLEECGERLTTAIESVRVPTIAAMAGHSIGGGVLIATSCDLRIASPSLKFGFPLARTSGSCLSMRNFARLITLVGHNRAKEMIMSARFLTADELLAAGGLNEIVPNEDQLLPRAQEVAETFSNLSPLTIWATKEMARRIRDFNIPANADADLLSACYLSDDFRRAVSAFKEKDAFEWTGR